MSEPICGNCGKPRSQHYGEDKDYCREAVSYFQTDFSETPSDSTLMSWLRHESPVLYEQAVLRWKQAHGHEPRKEPDAASA